MAEVKKSVELAASAAEVWALVGRFGDLHTWHPWVPNCTLSGDGLTRTIHLGGTAAIEVLDPAQTTPLSHSYRVEQSPMPIRDYTATWSARDTDGGCTVSIEARFEPAGVPEAQAVAMIGGFFDTAFSTLATRFGARG